MPAENEITVFSPHLDDAALDCTDHILAWKKLGFHVHVVTFFTKSASRSPEDLTCDSSDDLERRRTCEDKDAMNRLGVSWSHLSFADVWFRRENERLNCTNELLLHEASNDRILRALTSAILSFRDSGLFVVPLGVGGHVDHLLVREAAEFEIEPTELCYYVDYPYALSVFNWAVSDLWRVMKAKKSIKVMSNAKKQLLEVYSSQIPQVFSHARFSMPWIAWTFVRSYPEIVLYHKRTRLRAEEVSHT